MPVYVLPRDRDTAGGPSICDESLSRRLEPLRDAIDGLRDSDGKPGPRHGEAPPIGEGKGVMSPIAVNCGEDMIDAGDNDPALEMGGAMRARRLGVRRGILLDKMDSESESRELVGRVLGKSVRICSDGNGLDVEGVRLSTKRGASSFSFAS